MKQYIGISRDHSYSMQSLAENAKNDYNQNIQSMKTAAIREGIDTIVSVVECGGTVKRVVVNSGIMSLKTLQTYPTPGTNTPLFDSVNELINIMSAVPDKDGNDVSFLIMAVTDGENNAGMISGPTLAYKIKTLQSTDRWTFVFRVPVGGSRTLMNLGIPAGNIQEWEQTEKGMRESSIQTQSAVSSYFSGVARGVRSTSSFYSDLKGTTKKDIKSTMTNISSEVRIWPVKNDGRIDEFVEEKTKKGYRLGSAFYQLMKREKAVQEYKLIVIRDKKKGDVYAGQSARDLLGLPTDRTIALNPGDHSHYDIFIQSTSVNRKLIGGTYLLYWENATGMAGVHPVKKVAKRR